MGTKIRLQSFLNIALPWRPEGRRSSSYLSTRIVGPFGTSTLTTVKMVATPILDSATATQTESQFFTDRSIINSVSFFKKKK